MDFQQSMFHLLLGQILRFRRSTVCAQDEEGEKYHN